MNCNTTTTTKRKCHTNTACPFRYILLCIQLKLFMKYWAPCKYVGVLVNPRVKHILAYYRIAIVKLHKSFKLYNIYPKSEKTWTYNICALNHRCISFRPIIKIGKFEQNAYAKIKNVLVSVFPLSKTIQSISDYYRTIICAKNVRDLVVNRTLLFMKSIQYRCHSPYGILCQGNHKTTLYAGINPTPVFFCI